MLIVAVTGTNGKTTTARMIAHIFKGIGRKVGMTSTDGIVIDERLVIKSDASGPRSACMVLQNPRVDFAVMEVARGGILREGLGYDRNDVAVVTTSPPDHLGMRGIDTLEQLADVKAVVVEAVPRDGFAVLNADDDHVRRMRRRCSGGIVWFSRSRPAPRSASSSRTTADAVAGPSPEHTDKGDMIVIKHGRRSMQLARLPAVDVRRHRQVQRRQRDGRGGRRRRWRYLHEIRQGLRTFATSYYLSRPHEPGQRQQHRRVRRLLPTLPARVLGDFVESYSAQKAGQADLGRISRLGVIATAGDRRDDDMRELGAIAAKHFDVLVVREDERLRTQARRVRRELVAGGRPRPARPGGRALPPGGGRPRRDRGPAPHHGPCQPGRRRRAVRRQAR